MVALDAAEIKTHDERPERLRSRAPECSFAAIAGDTDITVQQRRRDSLSASCQNIQTDSVVI